MENSNIWIGIDNMNAVDTYTSYNGSTLAFTNWKNCPEDEFGRIEIVDTTHNCSLNTTDIYQTIPHKAAVINSNYTFDSKWLTDSINDENDFVCYKDLSGKSN